MSEYYDRNGNPITSYQWQTKFNELSYKRIDYTELPNGYVSTVWLGLNHSWEANKILIFESMAFLNDGGELQERYATEKEAREGHKKMVAEISIPDNIELNHLEDREI